MSNLGKAREAPGGLKIGWVAPAQALIAVTCSAIFISVVFWTNTFGRHTPIHPIAFGLTFLAINYGKLRPHPIGLACLSCYSVCVIALQLYGQSIEVLDRVLFVVLSTVAYSTWDRRRFEWYRRWMTLVSVALVIGALFGEAYSLASRPGIPIFPNSDGSIITLYGTTFATTVYGGAIRASGIYDEAGTFVFVIWVTILCRLASGKNDKWTQFLVVAGFCTFSFVHAILAIVYFVGTARKLAVGWRLIPLALTVLFVLWILAPADLSDYTDRFRVENGRFVGDNRTQQVYSFFENIDAHVFFLGDESILTGTSKFDYSSNPFNPIVNNGIIISLPYYIILCWLGIITLSGPRRIEAVILLILILQRPYLFTFGYCYMIVVCLHWIRLARCEERLRVNGVGPRRGEIPASQGLARIAR